MELEYGSDESVALYDGLFGDAVPSADEVEAIAGYVASSTLEKGDTLMFKQMTGDLLYYLTLQRGEGFKEGLASLIDNQILSKPDIWKTSDDSLKVVGMAQMYDDLLSRTTPGKSVPDMKFPGVLLSKGKEKTGAFRILLKNPKQTCGKEGLYPPFFRGGQASRWKPHSIYNIGPRGIFPLRQSAEDSRLSLL